MSAAELAATAQAMVAPGKGILAIDESLGSIKKRFDAVGIECTEENRRAYREVLITNPGGAQFVSGMILFDETIKQSTRDGTPFPLALAKAGIIPGIKVDAGTKDFALHPGEKITEGLDCLRERLANYYKLGARFAKWRAVITIGPGIPTAACIDANTHALARYAALCQEQGLVPIVEPETLMDADNTIERCYEVTEQALRSLFTALHHQGVVLEHLILKPNMVIPGKKCPKQASVKHVAEQTVRCLRNNVPAAVPGIVFLSGGQSEKQATEHLNYMNAQLGPHPWKLSFSYGRALQESCLKTWAGKAENLAAAQKALLHREKCNGHAALGTYTEAMEHAA